MHIVTRATDRNTPWELARGVFCLGPSGRTQTMVYLVGSEGSWVLVDTGWASDAARIARAAAALFGPTTRPAAIVLTHVHPDHAGSARTLAERWRAPVYVHPAELSIASGDFGAMWAFAGPLDRWLILPLMGAIGRRRREALIARSSLSGVVQALDTNGAVPGLTDWAWVHTPGHTPGHVSLFRATDRIAITGDALVTMRVNSLWGMLFGCPGLSGPPRYTTWDWRQAKEAVAALSRLEPRVIAGGHGMPMAETGTAATLATFARRIGAWRLQGSRSQLRCGSPWR